MTLRQLKKKLYELTCAYFDSGKVIWGMAGAVSPRLPYICLSMGDLARPFLPVRGDANGITVHTYPSKTKLQVDLFTTGVSASEEDGATSAHENTAVNDLTGFVNFLNSEYVDDWCGINDVSVIAGDIRDLTALTNDTSWEYRAMVELDIGFMQSTAGHTATNHENGLPLYENGQRMYDDDGMPLDENGQPLPEGAPYPMPPSGGVKNELADQFTGWFEEVEKPLLEQEGK